MRPVRCACGNWLGVLHPDGRFEMRHRGRRSIGPCPDEIVCEKCSDVWRRETSEGREHRLPALVSAG